MTWRKCGLICALLWLPIIWVASNSMLSSLAPNYVAKAECPAPPQEEPCLAPTIVCDGYTDNAPALQAAIDELVAFGGGVLMLPNCDKGAIFGKVWLTTGTVTIHAPD